jgi:hypothetical protein
MTMQNTRGIIASRVGYNRIQIDRFMTLHLFLSCSVAVATFLGVKAPRVLETQTAQMMLIGEVTYDGSVASFESFLIEKWRSMGFLMPVDGQRFTWDQYVEAVTDNIPLIGDLVAFTDDDGDKLAGIISYINAPKAAVLVYVPVGPRAAQYMGVQGTKILLLIRPKAKAGGQRI